jgi:hypothetical protein
MENQMLFECTATSLNLRNSPEGVIIGELRLGDLFEVDINKSMELWVTGTVKTGFDTGKKGFVRRKWLIQNFSSPPIISDLNRTKAANIISNRTLEFDSVTYKLGDKAKTWKILEKMQHIDCSGWIYLICSEIISEYNLKTKPTIFDTYSDEQITNTGLATQIVISGHYIQNYNLKPGVLLGIDFSEYSWDRGRPLDIDHIVIIGEDENGLFISQSSSSGGGVNKVSLEKWINSNKNLINQNRVHLVDVLMLG